MNINEEIKKSLYNWGSHPVFIELQSNKQPIYTSAKQFKEKILEISRFLEKSGIQKNYLVAIFLENSVDFIACFLSLIEINAKPIPLKLEYRKIELDEIFSNAQPQAVITEENHLPIITSYIKEKIVITRKEYKLKVFQSQSKKADPSEIDDSIASINYTYRGYGYPLGVMVPHAQYISGAKIMSKGAQYKTGEKMMAILPMAHIFTLVGCIFTSFFSRMTSIITVTLNPRTIFKYISDFQINNIVSVPEIYELLFRVRYMAGDLSSLTIFLSGGSILSENKYHEIKNKFNVELLHGYGLTEFTPVTGNIIGMTKAGTVGATSSAIEVKINPEEKDDHGEILIKSPEMSKGYYKRPIETKKSFKNDWFMTGDV